MKFLQERLKKAKENKKGFTLVEIVVVLVIIAILATLMLGALNGYIDKANEKKVTADCRSVVLAAETELAEAYAAGKIDDGAELKNDSESPVSGADVKTLAGLDNKTVTFTVSYDAKGNVTAANLTEGGVTVYYSNGNFSTKAPAEAEKKEG